MGYNQDMGLGWPWSKLGYSLVNLQKTMERSTELKIEPKVESQEPVDVNLGGGEGSTSQAGSSSQSGGVSRPDSLGSYPRASVGVKRKWSEEDLLNERRGP